MLTQFGRSAQTSLTARIAPLQSFEVPVIACHESYGKQVLVKHAAVITAEEEDKLWESGAIGIYSPKALSRCVLYYVGKAFCIRGGQEQRDLKPSQFIREYNPDRYTYVREWIQKTIQVILAAAVTPTRWWLPTLKLIIHHQNASFTYSVSPKCQSARGMQGHSNKIKQEFGLTDFPKVCETIF